MGSPSLVRRRKRWWLHTPLEKKFGSPAKIEQQVTTNAHTRICAVDLNLDTHLAVCTVQTVEGTILATRFIGHGREISGFRKQQLGRIARNRSKTGIIAISEQDNADLWCKIKQVDEQIAAAALDLLEVDPLGFDSLDRKLLLMIMEKFDGGPVGIESLAAAIGEERGTLEDVIEPYLIQQGFLARTARGRIATRSAWQHFGLKVPERAAANLPLFGDNP
jgi:hypothetical protein